MGYAKYHEDDLRIIDNRIYFHDQKQDSSTKPRYNKQPDQTRIKCLCPFCGTGYINHIKLVNHVYTSHGGVHDFVYVNNQKVYGNVFVDKHIHSIKLFSFREEPRRIVLTDSLGKSFMFTTVPEKYEYDILSILQSKLYSEIRIGNIDKPVTIKQLLNISSASMDSIISGKYKSYYFDEQFSDEKLSLEECLIYLKMLINEKTETDSCIERIGLMNCKSSRELEELYYYHLLNTGSMDGIESCINQTVANALLCILNGKYEEADSIIGSSKDKSNDVQGCRLILSLLKNDKLKVDYLAEKYKPYGIIGILEQVLYYYCYYETLEPRLLISEYDELRLFSKYPLINAILELAESIKSYRGIDSGPYELLHCMTPLAAVHLCIGLNDEKAKEKILKSNAKVFKDSQLLKNYTFKNNYSWIQKRITVSDGDLYRKAVLRKNKEIGNPFSESFINEYPFDDQISITPLGGESGIGASCFVISYKGYHVMLDCGINVNKYNDDAYPLLDEWNNGIDAIIISHAHIDHSGGVAKAHAMWPDADIITTAPTKIFIKYLLADMAKVSNGISDDHEIMNISIAKDVMLDTLNCIVTANYGEWINIGGRIDMRLHPAGHIVGAAMIELVIDGKTILYTGDFCNYSQMLTGNYSLSELPADIDYLITEATYLKRPQIDWNQQCENLKKEILENVRHHRAVLLPAASIGRSQELACIIGEMKLKGEISVDTPLYLAGMAIPSTTQIIPLMNERYASVVGLFEEFDGTTYPEDNAIVIGSSGSMTKGSASYKIASFWNRYHVDYRILANGYLDDDTEVNSRNIDRHERVKRLTLSTHADMKGLNELIGYVSPKVISFVHLGTCNEEDVINLIKDTVEHFGGDIMYRNLKANKTNRVFDMYEWMAERD